MRRAYPALAALGLLLASVGTHPTFAQTQTDTDELAPLQAQTDEELAQPTGQGTPSGPPGRALVRLRSDRFLLIQGSVLLERTETGRTAVTVTVYNLEPGSTHVNYIRGGSCAGPILIPLQDLVADHRGIATGFTQVPAPLDVDNWWINVHGWETLPSPGITCGKVVPPPARAERPAPAPGGRGPAPLGPAVGPSGPTSPQPNR
jgi:hypothetical protein